MKRFPYLIVIGFTLLCSGALADQNDARLDNLFKALQSSSEERILNRIEGEIWEIWLDSGRSDVNYMMVAGMRAMQAQRFDIALKIFDQVVEMAPEFAEGWNKRATVHYLRDNLSQSIQDIQRTLELEPRHFGALSGMGLIFIDIGDAQGALKTYEEVIKIHPNSPSAKANVESLRVKLRGLAI